VPISEAKIWSKPCEYCLRQLFRVGEIRVIKGLTGLFISFPNKKLRDGIYWDIAFPTNTETRRIIEKAILVEYEETVGKSD
jgi:DNA-binding cell septation regulator SpoVG